MTSSASRIGLDAAELLSGMLAIPSFSGDELTLARWLLQELRPVGFETSLDMAGNLVASWGSGDEVVLLGHLDTAPGLVPVRREGSLLYGRGAVDAKGPLCAALAAVSRLPRAGRTYTVIGAVQEESSSVGARHLLGRPAPSNLVILEPSGWDAITIGYKGSLSLTYRNALGAAHTAGPERSAADAMLAFSQNVQAHLATLNEGKALFDRVDARVVRCAAGGDGLVDRAELVMNLRLPPGTGAPDLKPVLVGLAEGADISFQGGERAHRAAKNTPLVRAFLQAIREAGGSPRFKLKTGTSDMNILAPIWGCPTLAYGPGDSKLDHTPTEAVSVDELDKSVGILEAALRGLP